MNDDVYVHIIDFGVSSVTEAVTQNEDGSYTVFLNARLTHEQHIKSYLHALYHIMRDDFEKTDVDLIESECHELQGGCL